MTMADIAPSAASAADLIARLRPISGFEEEYVAAHADTPNTAALCNELLARCLVPPGCDPGERRAEVAGLLVPERDRALVALRCKSFGDRLDSEATCPACGAANAIGFALSELPLGTPAQTRVVVVEVGGTTSVVRLPTAADQEALLRDPGATVAARRTALVARLVARIDDRTGPLSEDEARALPSAVRVAIELAIEAALPAADLSIDTACSGCGAPFEVPFELRAFFLPS
jgi:hypothetical protein